MLTADCKQLIDNDRLRFGLNDLNPDWLLANGFVRTWLWYDWGGSPFHVDVLLTPDGANLSMTNSGKVLENVSREQVVEVLDACRTLNRAFGGSDPTPSSYQKAQGILNAAARPSPPSPDPNEDERDLTPFGASDMAYDLVRLAMIRACEKYGAGAEYLFCAAGFGVEMKRLSGLEGTLDGHLVRAILCGRDDVEILSGDAMFRMVPQRSVTP